MHIWRRGYTLLSENSIIILLHPVMWSIMIDCWDSLWLWLVWVKNAKSIFLVTHGGAKSPSCLSYKPGTWVNLFSQPWCRGLSAPSGPAIHPLLQVLYRHRWQTAVCEASTFPFAAETLRWDSFFTKSIKDANPNKNMFYISNHKYIFANT